MPTPWAGRPPTEGCANALGRRKTQGLHVRRSDDGTKDPAASPRCDLLLVTIALATVAGVMQLASAASDPPSTYSGTRLTAKQAAQYAYNAGFRTENQILAVVSIGIVESGLVTQARNWHPEFGYRPASDAIGVQGPAFGLERQPADACRPGRVADLVALVAAVHRRASRQPGDRGEGDVRDQSQRHRLQPLGHLQVG